MELNNIVRRNVVIFMIFIKMLNLNVRKKIIVFIQYLYKPLKKTYDELCIILSINVDEPKQFIHIKRRTNLIKTKTFYMAINSSKMAKIF